MLICYTLCCERVCSFYIVALSLWSSLMQQYDSYLSCSYRVYSNTTLEQCFDAIRKYTCYVYHLLDLPSYEVRLTRMKKRKSPCVDVCQFTGPSGWCIGCGRSREECARWKKMKPFEVNKIENEIKQRMAKMAQTPPSFL